MDRAREGEKHSFIDQGTGRKVTKIVLPACNSKTGGRWYCLTHGEESLANNFEMQAHCDGPGKHKIGWICFEHGLERP